MQCIRKIGKKSAELAHVGHWQADKQKGVYTVVSEEFARIHGYTVDEFMARYKSLEQWRETVHPKDRPNLFEKYEGLENANTGFRIFHRDGSVRHVREIYSPILDEAGNLVASEGTLQDVTELRQVEIELSLSENQLRLITDNVPALIALVDTKKNYIYTNERYNKFFKCAGEDIIGRSVREIIGAEAFEHALPYMEKVLQGQTVEFEIEIPRAIEKSGYLSVVYVPHLDSAGIDGFLVLLLDITQRKRMEEQLQHAEKMIALGNLSAGIGHELNQPLGAVVLKSQMLAKLTDRGDLEKIRTVSESIVEQILRAKTIVDALRTFSRADTNVERSLHDVNKIVREVAVLCGDELKLNQVELELALSEEEIVTTLSSVQMGQVLSNLISNAKDAVEHQAVKRIRISTRLDNEYIIVEVSDTGLGIPESLIANIFDPFFTTKGVGKGTGLGLSLSYNMVKDNGGNIAVASEEGKGAKFVITLPVKGVTSVEKKYPSS